MVKVRLPFPSMPPPNGSSRIGVSSPLFSSPSPFPIKNASSPAASPSRRRRTRRTKTNQEKEKKTRKKKKRYKQSALAFSLCVCAGVFLTGSGGREFEGQDASDDGVIGVVGEGEVESIILVDQSRWEMSRGDGESSDWLQNSERGAIVERVGFHYRLQLKVLISSSALPRSEVPTETDRRGSFSHL
jgi:hypothetical protein